MPFRSRKLSLYDACALGLRNDLNQIGASAEICNEVTSIRLKNQFDTLSRNRHLARDIGLIR